MIEELKLLVDAVANLPTLMVWVLVGFLAYKLAVVGSVYGIIRLAINKAFDAYAKPKDFTLMGLAINNATEQELYRQFMRLRKNSNYIHTSDVDRLAKAIDKMESEK